MLYSEDDLLPISALQHFVFCERQAALIHLERAWEENVHTVEGRHLHVTAHENGVEQRGDVRIVRAMPLRSLTLGVAGVADVIEFRCIGARWLAFPIEYKKGKPKRHRADEVQLCAQALCLEEMLQSEISTGALFYVKTRRRRKVAFDRELRSITGAAAGRFRALMESRRTPPAQYAPKCRECSLIDLCRPRAAERSAARFLTSALRASSEELV